MSKEKHPSGQRTHELSGRLGVTIVLIVLYLIGRNIVIYGVDVTAYSTQELSADTLILSMVSGDRNRYSLLALGVMPYIMSSLLVSFVLSAGGKSLKKNFSPQRIEKYTFLLMLILAVFFANSRAMELVFRQSIHANNMLVALAMIQMTVGAALVYCLTKINKDHGIGGQSVFIIINLFDGMINMIRLSSAKEIFPIAVICVVLVVIVIFTEIYTVRIPVQRVSIHNIHAKNSFIEFKLNPIGVMPIMFASSFLMIPRALCSFFAKHWPDINSTYPTREAFAYVSDRLVLTDEVGVIVYLIIILFLSIAFSFVLLSPAELADNLQRLGDSIVNVYAGAKTKKYLTKVLIGLSIFSGLFLSVAMGVPLFLSLKSGISTEIAMLPSSVLMLTSLNINLASEVRAYRRYDSYNFFM